MIEEKEQSKQQEEKSKDIASVLELVNFDRLNQSASSLFVNKDRMKQLEKIRNDIERI